MPRRLALLALLLLSVGCKSPKPQAGLGAPQHALSPPSPIYLTDGTGADASLLGTSDNPLVVNSVAAKLGSAKPALSPPNPFYVVDNTSGSAAMLLGTADNPMVITGTTTPSGTVGGDLSGSLPNPTVAKVNGSSAPAGGSLTTGNVLQASGASALSYAAVNLAGGAGYVIGSLPAGNQAAQTCTGDVTGNTGATVVSAISGSTPIVVTPSELRFVAGAAPLLDQAQTDAGASTVTIRGQQSTADAGVNNATGIVAVDFPVPQSGGARGYFLTEQDGGASVSLACDPASLSYCGLFSGVPSSSDFIAMSNGASTYFNAPNGSALFCSGGTGGCGITVTSTAVVQETFPVGGASGSPYQWQKTASAIACSTGGTQTISAAQAGTPGLIVTSGTLSSNCILDFSTNASNGWYVLDMSGVTLGASFGVQFKNGTATATFLSAALPAGQTMATVWTHGTNTLAVQY